MSKQNQAAPAAENVSAVPTRAAPADAQGNAFAAPTAVVAADPLAEKRAVVARFEQGEEEPAESAPAADVLAQLEADRREMDEMKRRLIAEEHQAQRLARAELEQARREGRAPQPVTASSINTLDSSYIPAPPGFVGRWVRTTDQQERPSGERMREMRPFGYRQAKDEDGNPIVSSLGAAMLAPLEGEARRKAIAEKDLTPVSAAEAEFENAVDSINRSYGKRVLIPTRTEQHRVGS